jgi:hypothetical protein
MLQERVADDPRRLRRGGEIAAHVRAGAEGARSRAGEDDAAAIPPVELVPEPREVRHHLTRQRVEPRLVVDGEHDHVAAVLADLDVHRQPRNSGTTTIFP